MIGKTIEFEGRKESPNNVFGERANFTGIVLDKIKRKGTHLYLIQYTNQKGIKVTGLLNPEYIRLVYES